MKLSQWIHFSPALVFLSLTGCDSLPGGSVKIETDEQKAIYFVGQQIGRELKSQGINVDQKVLMTSIDDALQGKESRVPMEELQKALMNVRKTVMENQQKQAEGNLETGKKFLEENKGKPDVVTTESGLQYKVEKEGTGKSPKETSRVKVHYRGTLVNGDEFDSSYSRNEPATFPLNGVIKGWTEGLQKMKVGGKTRFFISPELGYGPAAKPGIPANSVLIFDVELLEIVE